jgi:hypothetical protein
MNLTESIKHLMSEGKLEWTTTDDVTGAEEAALPDGAKFALHNIMGTLSLMYVGKDGKGNVIYRTPIGVPMAFKKAKQEAEKFLGIKKDKKADKKEDEVEEELGPENEWGTDELTNKEKAVTPGQTPKESFEEAYASVKHDSETGLSKRYVSGLSSSTAKARKAHWDKTSKMSDSDPKAYTPAPGDASVKTKPSEYTKKYHQMFGEEDEVLDEGSAQTALANKAKKSGVGLSTLKKVYARGVAAWKTGHRPGTNPQQWGMARVNSYITKGKGTYGGADKDLHEADEEDLASLQDLFNNPDEEFAKKNYGSVDRYKKMIQSKIDRLQKNEAITGAEQVTLKSTDKLEVKYGSVLVNGRPFDVTDPDESLDWPKAIDANGNLVTWFKGRASNANTWSPEEITGHYTDKHATVEEQPEISERYIQTVRLITKETDRSIIEAFLTKHSVAGRESNLLSINTEFKRFKKLHEAKI